MSLFKAVLKYTGPEAPERDTVIVSGVSEAGARAYALFKNYTEGIAPGHFSVRPFEAGGIAQIPDDFKEPAEAAPEAEPALLPEDMTDTQLDALTRPEDTLTEPEK